VVSLKQEGQVRVLVVYAHPVEDSFAATLRDTVVAALREGGHEVDLADLYAEGFDPVLSRQERIDYRTVPENRASVATYVARLERAEGVILVFPSWWYGMPAILKGWFDRVWLPGVAFDFGPQAIRPLLTGLRLFGVVTTTGAPGWFTRLYMGNPSRKVLMRGLSRLLPARRVERFWLALYGMDRSTAEQRGRFVERVRRRVAAVR
jgi:putative NADPH-quinone reductase